MPYADSFIRDALNRRADLARNRGAVPESRFSVYREGTEESPREEGRFFDQSGRQLVGEMTLGGNQTLG